MEFPLVSVLMVSYNSEKFIKEAIDSVLNQTYNNFEIIICDDNSQDDTKTIINVYSDSRIRKFFNEKNLGEYLNRNNAVFHSKGEYIIFIDADDLMYPHGLAFIMDFAREFPECGMLISREWEERVIYPKVISPHQFYCFEFLDMGICGINFTKVLFKTKALKATSLFPPKVKLGDLYIQYEMALTEYALIIPDASTWWRRRPGQASEKLLNDVVIHTTHDLWIKIEKLNDPRCPLSDEERQLAFKNIYGAFLRHLLRLIFKLKWSSVIKLYKLYPVPFKYITAVFEQQQRDYFNIYNGNNPLKETAADLVS